jgi:tRNA (guanine37-N1)-methyltransferase
MRFEAVTIFPELIAPVMQVGLLGKAAQAGRIALHTCSPRDFATDKHRSVDDTPYGGGSGMVMLPEPLLAAIEALDRRAAERGEPKARRILLTPSGKPFRQADAERWALEQALMFVCGRYEGVDERVNEHVDETVSLGDFVLNGGEVAAMAIIEAVARLLPEVLGNAESLREESHATGLLEYPQYTRPREFRGSAVPEVLLSGDHARIAAWRRERSLERTAALRPELLQRATLTADERARLDDRTALRAPVYCAVLHHPVRDRAGETVTSAVTTLDVHDIARSARTYGLAGYFVVTPIEAQRTLVESLLTHWDEGPGRRRMPERSRALELVRVRESLDQVRAELAAGEGRAPTVIATTARSRHGALGLATLRGRLGAEPGPFLILFGTGHGLEDSVLGQADAVLEPIHGVAGYNHLSVRSAAAIILDRILGPER